MEFEVIKDRTGVYGIMKKDLRGEFTGYLQLDEGIHTDYRTLKNLYDALHKFFNK